MRFCAHPSSLVAVLVGASLTATVAGAVVDTGQDASGLPFVACGGRVGFRTLEASQGGTDLTGDSDSLDTVLQVVAVGSGVVTNVAIDGSGALGCGGDLFGFGASEGAENTDFNGDGDKADFGLFAYDAATTTLTGAGRSVTAVAVSSAIVAFTVPEATEGAGGTDLNGDGDKVDQVLHVFHPASATVINVGQEAGDAASIVARGQTVAFLTSELAQGATDLNGDGDTADNVLQVYDFATTTLTNTQRAVAPNPTGATVQFNGIAVAFLVRELDQGVVSLNGDLDLGDTVAQFYCLPGAPCAFPGSVTNLAVDASGGFSLGADLLAFGVRERNQNTSDLNLDGDAKDTVVSVYRFSTGTSQGPERALVGQMAVADPYVVFAASERRQGLADLNGDGDHKDLVVHVYDATTDVVTNLQRAVWKTCPRQATARKPKGPCLAAAGDAAIFAVPEKGQGAADLTGDGDLSDIVPATYRLSSGTGVAVSTGFAMEKHSALAAGGTTAGLRASERRQGFTPLNGDGDAKDQVAVAVDVTTGTPTNVAEAADELILVENGRLVFRTIEADQAADRNADSDTFDAVLQYQ